VISLSYSLPSFVGDETKSILIENGSYLFCHVIIEKNGDR
jgi:hypothetical protein